MTLNTGQLLVLILELGCRKLTEYPPGFRWLHESFGTNWRLTEMQSAIGRIQLVDIPEHIKHAHYKYYAFIKPELLVDGWTRDRIVNEINALGVPCFQGSCSEVYLEKAFDNTEFKPKKSLAVAKELGETSLMFLVHPTLTSDEIELTCQAIKSVLNKASK